MRVMQWLWITTVCLLSACVTIEDAEPLKWEERYGVTPVRALPEKLPSGISRIEDTQYIVVHAKRGSELAASLVIPIPFVTDAAISSYKSHQDNKGKDHYIGLDPYQLTVDAMRERSVYRETGGEYRLYPVVVLSETDESGYLVSLVYQIEKGEWMTRYYYHLPMTLPAEAIQAPSDEQLSELHSQLNVGVGVLMSMLDRRIKNELPEHGPKVTLGSLYFLSGSIGGLVDAEVFRVKNSELLEETATTIIARVPGAPNSDAAGGALAYGVHYFYKDQLHLFEKSAR